MTLIPCAECDQKIPEENENAPSGGAYLRDAQPAEALEERQDKVGRILDVKGGDCKKGAHMRIPHHFERSVAVAALAALTFVPFPIYAQNVCLDDPVLLVDASGKSLLRNANDAVQFGHPKDAKRYLQEAILCTDDNDVKVSA